jgi:hypothetical protein
MPDRAGRSETTQQTEREEREYIEQVIIYNEGVAKLLETAMITVEEIKAVYHESKAKFQAITAENVCKLMLECNISFEQVCALYDKKEYKFQAVTAIDVCELMLGFNISFKQVCALYDDSPHKLKTVSNVNIGKRLLKRGVELEQICELYNRSPSLLMQLAREEVINQPYLIFNACLQWALDHGDAMHSSNLLIELYVYGANIKNARDVAQTSGVYSVVALAA